MNREWSDQQRDIFAWFGGDRDRLAAQLAAQPDCNPDFLLGQARAGTGKTTTIVEALSYARERSILLAAFSKTTKEELRRRVPSPAIRVATLNGVGLGIVLQNWPGVPSEPNPRRSMDLATRAAGEDTNHEIIKLVWQLARWGKTLHPFAKVESLVRIAEERGCEPDHSWAESGWTVEAVARAAHRAMELAKERPIEGGIDYDDQVFLPLVMGWVRPRYDLVVVDEYQDMGNALLMLARRLCKRRLCFVGDDRQAIFGFRGADARFIENMMKRMQPFVLPLNYTYRCPKSVVELAQKLVPDYHAAPSAPEGKVEAIHEMQIPALAQAGDFVLSRTNAPLARWCLALIRASKPAIIEGRNVVSKLLRIVRGTQAQTIAEFLPALEAWRKEEEAAIRADGDPNEDKFIKARLDTVGDTVDCLRILADGLLLTRELVQRVESMFAKKDEGDDERRGKVRLMTIHRAKGLEARRVMLLIDTLYPKKSERDPEEQNMHYVAITRAMEHLLLASQTPERAHLVGTPAFRGDRDDEDDGAQGEMFKDDDEEDDDAA